MVPVKFKKLIFRKCSGNVTPVVPIGFLEKKTGNLIQPFGQLLANIYKNILYTGLP